MKKITMRRRMLSLTLAASVALPQASSAFAASLWNEDGENDHISHVIESSQPDAQESAMPWITLPPDDKASQPPETVTPSSEPFDETMEGILTDGDHPEPPSMADDGETTSTPAPTETGTGEIPPDREEGEPPSVDVTTEPTHSAEPSPTETEPAGEVTTPVTTPENTADPDPAPTPEPPPDFGEDVPAEGEDDLDLTTPETVGGEEDSANIEEVTTAPVTDVDGAAFAMPYSAPEGVTLSQWMSYRLGYGVQVETTEEDGRVYPSKKLLELDSHFAVESTESANRYGYRDYGENLNGPNWKPSEPIEADGYQVPEEEVERYDRYSLCVFPSAAALGRVPDQQFMGWYVYPSGAKAGLTDGSQAAKWVYDDWKQASVTGTMTEVTTYPYQAGDPYYDETEGYSNGKFGELGDTWDGGINYPYGHYAARENGKIQFRLDDYGFMQFYELITGDGMTNPVSIVGRWKDSDESQASDIKLTADVDGKKTLLPLYTEDITGTYVDGTAATTFKDSDTQEYWLRVPSDVDKLSLDLSTVELYYKDYDYTDLDDYNSYTLNTGRSHVEVTATFNGVTTSYTNDLSARMLPAWTVNGYFINPQNSRDDPAHSEWSVPEIGLQKSNRESLYNDIVVTVKSPSDDKTTTYIFHVQRLTEPTLTRSSGNTPVGMLYRDAASGGAIGSAGNGDSVAVAEEKFKENRKFGVQQGTYPNGSVNQNGTVFRDTYNINAWPADDDVDLDKTAIVVYQDSIFKDPGIALTDSEGKLVDITKGNVSRSLMLKQVDTLSVKQIGKTGAGENCWYRSGSLLREDNPALNEDGVFSVDLTFEPIWERNGSDYIDLRGKNVLPGIYTIEYRYADPVSGKVYSWDSDTYQTFRRTLVVLPTPGDVDMDGAVTMADALALQSLLSAVPGLGYTTLNGEIIRTEATVANGVTSNDLASLFAYRVCDINHDGVLDSSDVQLLRTLPNPKTINETRAANSDYFYIALPTGVSGDRYVRQPLATATDGETGKARLEMVYLGKEGGTRQLNGATADITGPWNALPATSEDGTKNGVEILDTFWLGVRLVDAQNLNLEPIKSFTFTLTYDTRYLEPAVVLSEDDWGKLVTGLESDAEKLRKRWSGMIRLYNLDSGAWDDAGRQMTVWGAAGDESYQFTDATGSGLRFTTHYSTAKIPLERVQSESVTETGRLQSITFSVELRNGQAPIRLQDMDGEEYLFVLPFRLLRHPFGLEEAQLVEFEAGMRSFTLVGVGSGGVTDIGTTYAYSVQETIFGGATENLAGHFAYGNAGAKIPLGEDRTEVYQIYNYNHDGQVGDSNSTVNGVYATSFLSGGGRTASGTFQAFAIDGVVSGELPPGLSYDSGSARMSGIPQRAGEYEFYIGNTPYRLKIEKADLHFWANSQSSYYGQPEFRNVASQDFTFSYKKEDICDFEVKRAEASGGTIVVDGRGIGLAALLDDSVYNANQPTFTAVTKDKAPVTFSTPVGTYDITNTLCPESTNYNFIYDPTLAGASAGLSIAPRPIEIVHINGDPDNPTVVGEVFSDQPGTLGNRTAQQGTDIPTEAHTFMVRLASTDGSYYGLPLTEGENYTDGVILPGDSLEITYAVDYIRNEEDIRVFGANSNLFYLRALKENRSVRVRDIRLTGGKRYENYRLVTGAADEPVTDGVVGRVLLRQTQALRISHLPILSYQYGDRFSQSNEFHFFILKDGDIREGEYRYSDNAVRELSIDAYWATAEEREAYLNGDKEYDYGTDRIQLATNQLFTMAFNGRYLCLAAQSVDDDGNAITIRSYADEPLVVTKRTITLTATPGHRYYGEENGTLTFTYDPAQLAANDWKTGLTGAGKELEDILAEDNYQAPELKAVEEAPTSLEELTNVVELTSKTRYTGRVNRVIIWGASSDNYQFIYNYTNSEGVTTAQEGYGASAYQIERRPIVVERIIKGEGEPLVKLYADTHVISTNNLSLSIDEVEVVLPNQDPTTKFAHFFRRQASTESWQDIGFEVTDAVVNGDKISFTYTATVIPTDGSDYMKYIDFSRGYFDMTHAEGGYRDYPVQVSNLQLKSADENDDAYNYELVYKSSDRGVLETVNQIKREPGIYPDISYNYNYYAVQTTAGQAIGRVYLRPIKEIEIISTGRMNYTYGETYDPTQGDWNVQNRRGMVIHIEYVNDEINNYAGNPTIGEVTFQAAGITDGKIVTTFDNRSLKIYYVKAGQTAEAAIEAGQELDLQDALYVQEHTGARLVVTGQRGEQTEPVISQCTNATLRIERKTLTLTAEDQHRVYGEANPEQFGFTFRADDLARWDREALGLNTIERGTGTQLAQMSRDLGYRYSAPVFGTEAKVNSNVLNGGRAGYPITNLTGKGELENYILQYEPGTLYVYPRPVNIQRFISSGDWPIYTIYSDVRDRIFYTNVTNVVKENGTDRTRFELGRPAHGYMLEDGTELPTTGAGLVPGDEITLRIKVSFEGASLNDSSIQENIPVTVEDAELVAGTAAASNYQLQISYGVASITDKNAIGRVEKRGITKIELESKPTVMEYTYGERLSLTGLAVKIHYNISGSESGTGKTDLVYYMGTDQFAAYGLHVYYYDSATLKDEYWGVIDKDYREAANGDHLTIAPTHDSQLAGGSSKWFHADGKYLVITAQQNGKPACSPLIVYDTKDTGKRVVPIKVNPLPIEFTLSAEDKIYDGNTQAAGTITFTNIFNQGGLVDSMNRSGVTDLVYPVLGADYEEKWTSNAYDTQSKFDDFRGYVTQNGYSFTTGNYVANDPSIFAENQKLNWTDGYKYGTAGTLAFSYLDPNVAYAQTPGHDFYGDLTTKEVQVTGLHLAGPDAANYTLVGKTAGQTVEVTTANVATAQGYLGSGLPTATIHKANRAAITDELLPQVEIDPHTNVVRINYDQSLSVITGGEESDHLDELHFEFALQQVITGDRTTQEPQPDPEEPVEGTEEGAETGIEALGEENDVTVTDIVQWAGKTGGDTWADPRYFGGEAAPMTGLEITTEDPEAGEYVPREEDIPKPDSITENTTIKGQVYQWSELDDGFTLDRTAYPGGVYWPGYELYATDRTALDRDAVYLAVVRAAETHNYNASPALSSVEGYTSAMIQAILEAYEARNTAKDQADYEQAQQDLDTAIQAAAEPLERAVLEAREAAQAEVDILMAAGEKGNKLEERPVREAAAAVKTYKQVIETVSIKAYQGASEDKNKKGDAYQVPTLEAVWFTDVETLPSKEVLDAVVWNTDPVRYRRYGYDSGLSVELKFTDGDPISLRKSYEVEIPRKGEEGPEWLRFNEGNNARLYVDTTFPSSSGSVNPDLMMIRPGGIMALLGDKPVLLEAVFYPAWTRPAVVHWSSSDPSVAVVDNMGRVSFVGVGTAVITAIVPGGYSGAAPVCSASITVTVAADWKKDYPNSIFDFGNQDAFLVSGTGAGGNGDKLFKPEMGITRGETAKLLAQFYVSNPGWTKRGPEEFTDLTGEEDYAEAAKLLGRLGVFMGYPEGDFGGEHYISRAEFVTLLARMTGLNIVDTAGQPHAFLDTGEEDTWAYAEIDALSRQTGILLGVGDGYFAPDRAITRSEVAALLTRLLRFPLTETGKLVVPLDVAEDHWARDCILRAVNGSQILEESFLGEMP